MFTLLRSILSSSNLCDCGQHFMKMGERVALLLLLTFWFVETFGVKGGEFYCREHCSFCKDVPNDCPAGSVFVTDGDMCQCCDVCVPMSNLGEDCGYQVATNKINGKIEIIKRHCWPGAECIGGVCDVSRSGGLCHPVKNGGSYKLRCDRQNNFIPVQCSHAHCWCVHQITGEYVRGTKVLLPLKYDKITNCNDLMYSTGISYDWINEREKIIKRGKEITSGSRERELDFRMHRKYVRRTAQAPVSITTNKGGYIKNKDNISNQAFVPREEIQAVESKSFGKTAKPSIMEIMDQTKLRMKDSAIGMEDEQIIL